MAVGDGPVVFREGRGAFLDPADDQDAADLGVEATDGRGLVQGEHVNGFDGDRLAVCVVLCDLNECAQPGHVRFHAHAAERHGRAAMADQSSRRRRQGCGH